MNNSPTDSLSIRFTLCSENKKTGPIPVSVTSSNSCPDSCSLKRLNACYAKFGNTAIHWRNLSEGKAKSALSWKGFLLLVSSLKVNTLWRHNEAGDLPGLNNEVDPVAIADLVDANKGKRGFTYTHKPILGNDIDSQCNRKTIAYANRNGFTVNLSADNMAMADAKADLGIGPVCVILPSDTVKNTATPAGRKVVVCPATLKPGKITCATCGLCQKANRPFIIGFPAHGTASKRTSAIAKGELK